MSHGVVCCGQPEAAEVGIEMLQAGGNAVDAAVACALTQSVIDPMMCGIAGFGSMAIYVPKSGAHEYVDFHSPAPAAARADMWEHLLRGETRDGFGFIVEGRRNDVGYESVGVPASLAGFAAAHAKYGLLPWADLVQPAIRWAVEGFFVRPGMYAFFMETEALGRAASADRLAFSKTGRAIYCEPDGTPKRIGTGIKNPDYAKTLEELAVAGADSFYRGPIARCIVDDFKQHGGLMSSHDLASYAPKWKAPLEATYRGLRLTTNNPPGGGVMLIEMLNILENFDLASLGHNSVDYIRVVSEAMKIATADKDRCVGDPAFVDIPLGELLSSGYAAEKASRIRRGEKADVKRIASPPIPANTTHLSIVDRDGNCVSMTHSLGMPSGVITDGLGFTYNGCMSVFDPRPGRAASIAPGKSRFTASAPTILFKEGEPFLVLGAPGGTQIVMGIVQVILNVVEFGMSLSDAIAAPRFSSTGNPIDVCNRIPRRIAAQLEDEGYQVIRNPNNYTIGVVHGVMRGPDGFFGSADPGRDGVAYRTDSF